MRYGNHTAPDADERPEQPAEHDLNPWSPAFAYDVGLGSGVAGETFGTLMQSVRREVRRPLSDRERSDLYAGWVAGTADRDAYLADQAALGTALPITEQDYPF